MTPSRRQTAGMTGSSPYVTPAPRSRIGDMSHVRFTSAWSSTNRAETPRDNQRACDIGETTAVPKSPKRSAYEEIQHPQITERAEQGQTHAGTLREQGCHSSICGPRAEQTQQDTQEYRPSTVMQAAMEHGHSNGIHQKADIQYHRNHSRQGPSHSNLTTRHQISSWCAERHVEPKPIHAITTPS